MREVDVLANRVKALEHRIRLLSIAAVLLATFALVAAGRPVADVIRTQGLVITDAAGRERIVLGAPMSGVSPNALLADAIGLAVVDSLGRLHIAVGTNTPLVLASGAIGKRIAGKAGLTFYDPRNGQERGGMGAFDDGRANVCIDYGTKAKEAACMAVAPNDQYAAFILNGTPAEPQFDRVTMYVGSDGSGSIKAFGGGSNNGGVLIRSGKGPPSMTVYDSAGSKVVSDLTKLRH
jgi:hypothetical protein